MENLPYLATLGLLGVPGVIKYVLHYVFCWRVWTDTHDPAAVQRAARATRPYRELPWGRGPSSDEGPAP